MWATLALATALQVAPAQPALALKNPVPTYGLYGQPRKEARLLTGDLFMLAYEIDGLKVNEDGRVFYSIAMELINNKNETVFKQEPRNLEATNTLGGSSKPAFAYLEIGTDTAAGKYSVKLTVTDRLAKTSQDLVYPFEVVSGEFGFVQCSITHPQLQPTPPIAVPGQEFWVNFAMVGFQLAGEEEDKQPDISVEMSVIDLATNKPTLSKPFPGGTKKVDEKFKKIIPMQFILQLNRPGRFRIDLKATDNHAKTSATQSLFFTVMTPAGK